jgi:hypothetical protein
MEKLIPLGDPNAAICEDDTCEVPRSTAPGAAQGAGGRVSQINGV